MDNCLLIGNGLNRCLKNSISWGDLLKGIAEEYGVSYNENISMPLEFERIVNEYLMSQEHPSIEIYSEIKKSVASKIGDTHLPIDDNVIHNRIKKLPIQSIITTNYDYLLEYVFDPNYKHQGDRTKKYLFGLTSVQKKYLFITHTALLQMKNQFVWVMNTIWELSSGLEKSLTQKKMVLLLK